MKPALVIVDMIRDNIDTRKHNKISREAREILAPLKRLIDFARAEKIPVIYANDSFLKDDFLFRSRLEEHALRGTVGTRVVKEIRPERGEHVIEKLRFSAFFKTDLDQVLRRLGVDTVLVAGISTMWCVLLTAADAVSHDFYTVILEDLTACHTKDVQKRVLDLYRNFVLYPILRVVPSQTVMDEYRQAAVTMRRD